MAPLLEADKVYSFFENDCAFAVLGDVATGKVAYENPLWASWKRSPTPPRGSRSPKGFKACDHRHPLIDNANMKASKTSLALRHLQ